MSKTGVSQADWIHVHRRIKGNLKLLSFAICPYCKDTLHSSSSFGQQVWEEVVGHCRKRFVKISKPPPHRIRSTMESNPQRSYALSWWMRFIFEARSGRKEKEEEETCLKAILTISSTLEMKKKLPLWNESSTRQEWTEVNSSDYTGQSSQELKTA